MIKSTHVNAHLTDGVLVAALTCEKLGEYESGIIQADIIAVAPASGWKLALNFKDVQMVASAGLGLIVSLNKLAKANKGGLVLFNLNDFLSQLLRTTRLNGGLAIKNDEPSAIKALK